MSLSPRERDILEHIESLLQDEDPELAARLTGMRPEEPARSAWWTPLLTVLSIAGGVALMVVAAISANPILMVVGVSAAVVVPIVTCVWHLWNRRRISEPAQVGSPQSGGQPEARTPWITQLRMTREPQKGDFAMNGPLVLLILLRSCTRW
jgi:hypothetical protein